jgi:glycosyltransferase involved in cell wall biosynthesis
MSESLVDNTQLVSIIVPCYNYGWILGETLDSLLAQSHRTWECLIVDDGSTDSTREVAAQYVACDPRFKYLYQENKGISAARNTGLEAAQGVYIQLLDADDLLVADKLAIQAAFLAAHSEVDIVYGDARYFLHTNPQQLSRSFDMSDQEWMVPLHGKGLPIIEKFIESNRLVVSAPLFRSTLLKKVGLFTLGLRSMEDWEFWMRCAIVGAYFHYDSSPNTLTLIRVHTSSLSQNNPRMLSYMMIVREELEKQLLKIGATSAAAYNRTELNAAREYSAVHHVRRGDLGTGLRLFWQTAQSTGRYSHYLRSAVYWWRNREPGASA